MKGACVLGLLLVGLPVFGADAAEKRWSDEGEISFVNTAGNSKITSLAGKNEMKYRFTDSLRGTWKAAALYGENDGVKTAESYATELKLNYLFSGGAYAFADAGWNKNEFAGIDRRLYGGLGAGYAFLGGPTQLLVGEIGVHYVTDEYTDSTDKDYAEGRAFGKYTYAFTEKTKFSQSLEFLDDLEDTQRYRLNSETAVVAALSGNLSLKTAYLVGYVHEPTPETLKKTDSMVTVTLVVTF